MVRSTFCRQSLPVGSWGERERKREREGGRREGGREGEMIHIEGPLDHYNRPSVMYPIALREGEREREVSPDS